MDWSRSLVALLAATFLLLDGCNSSSTSVGSSGGSGSTVTESFTLDAALRESVLGGKTFAEGMDLNPACVPVETHVEPPPEGWLVYDRDTPAESVEHLVVFAHGNGHSVGGAFDPIDNVFKPGSWLGHMRTQLSLAKADGVRVAFVATDYRDNFGFPTLWGAHDSIVATLYALQQFPNVKTVYLMGVSMGGAVSGTAILEAFNAGITKADSTSPLYDYWIDVEGVSQLSETWTEARVAGEATGESFAVNAADGIERDAGGKPPECPLAYQRRSPALNGPLFKLAGIKAATVVHAANDGVVPYNQGREMATELASAVIPTQFFTVLTTFFPFPGTTATSHTGADAALEQALQEYNDSGETGVIIPPTGDFSGHASERFYFHPVMATAFANLELMLNGSYREDVPYFECVVDETYDFYSFFAQANGLPLPETCQLDSLPE